MDVMMVTGYKEVSLAVEAMKLGAGEYLTKPVDPDDLVQRIGSSLRANAAEARLREIQADFTSRLLYEIHNPLGTIKSAAGFLLKGMAGPLTEQQQEVLSHIDSVSSKMIALVSDMIDLTKFELGRVHLEKHAVNLEQLLPKVCGRLEAVAKAKKLALQVTVDQSIPTMELDAEKIEQVLGNLIDNAIKYSHEGGTIVVAATSAKKTLNGSAKECAQIVVKDSGAGISAEELPYVFDKYKEFLTGKTSEKKTTGLGLAICRSIVEAHKGTLSVESEIGKGSTFTVVLPFDVA
jgi:signal transduction histidine kinase